MKKTILFGLAILISACQSTTAEPSPTPEATATRLTHTAMPATVTPSVTLSPTSTATLAPPERFFTDEFAIAPAYWSILYSSGNPNRVEVLSEDNSLTFGLYGQNIWMYAIYGAFEYEAVHIEIQVDSRGSDANSVGLLCHYDEQHGWYEFNISSDGTYNVLYAEWLVENIARYTPILNDQSERIETGNGTNQIGLDCYDDTMQLYINDKLIRKLDLANYGLSVGKVGLSLASFEDAPVIVSFDWVKIREP